MRFSLFFACVLLPLLAGGCARLGFHPAPKLDLSEPKSAALEFVHAIDRGDADAAKAASVGTDQQKQWVTAMCSMVGGLRRLDAAVTAKFGQSAVSTDAQLKSALHSISEEAVAAVSESDAEVTGDTARLVIPKNTYAVRRMAHASVLKRDEKGRWHVDLTATFKENPVLERERESSILKRYLTAGQELNDVAKEIRAGKYKTVSDARAAVDERLGEPQE